MTFILICFRFGLWLCFRLGYEALIYDGSVCDFLIGQHKSAQILGLEGYSLLIAVDGCIDSLQLASEVTVNIEVSAEIFHLIRNIDGHSAGKVKCRATWEGNIFEVLILKLGRDLFDCTLIVQHVYAFLTGYTHFISPHSVCEGHFVTICILVDRCKLLGCDNRCCWFHKDVLAIFCSFQCFLADCWVTNGQFSFCTAYNLTIRAFYCFYSALYFGLFGWPSSFCGHFQLVNIVFFLYLEGCYRVFTILHLGTDSYVFQMFIGQRNYLTVFLDVQRISIGLSWKKKLTESFLTEGKFELFVRCHVDCVCLLCKCVDAHAGQSTYC